MTEGDLVSKAAFAVGWGFFNFCWIAVLRRPAVAGAISLAWLVLLILLSQLKHSVLFMTVNFVDLMIIDTDTIEFLMTVFPGLGRDVAIAALLAVPLMGAIWWFDPVRVRPRTALLGIALCFAGLVTLAKANPSDPENEFYSGQYFSKYARSAVTAIGDYLSRGLLESDTQLVEHFKPVVGGDVCAPAHRPPHIVLVFDESSFDITNLPGIKTAPEYQRHFTSFDGKNRSFVVEGAGGPSWFTEYNVLTGLSVRSYGRFADFVTRIAAGRVERGLPWALRRCGYKTYSFYSFLGAFLSARRFQETAGIENFYDAKVMGANGVEPDSFFYDAARGVIAQNKNKQPLFLFVYTIANHFPWNYRFRPDAMPDWPAPGNSPEVDEYQRRQAMSAQDYASFVEKLRKDFPSESFLIVRFGDHLPGLAMTLLEPTLDPAAIAQHIRQRDPRYFTTYYAIDAVNFQPLDVSSALPRLDAPYLPVVLLEAAGLPLDASFSEQKRILERCHGLFYRCNSGAEARRFNRLLIDAGLIKGL
ncbi:MAG: sulfatase-like hydrolase/transferase [Alphaproteobacteria bacterium]